ncbi:MAG: hypothetical protein KDA86_22210 [Planctomycetaceae bacterium]|nr:hypothetical protein [Planctomycetaceae bacterium]
MSETSSINDVQYLPHKRRAIGSSYFIQQSPGAELLGGLEVVLRSPESDVGQIVVSNSLWQSDETREDIDDYQKQAVDGIHAYASEHEVDLTQFDVELRKFIIHDVDSHPRLYYFTAQNALQSALSSWFHPSLRIPDS